MRVDATITDADGTGTIVNDDAAPSFAIDDVTHNEGDTGTTSYVFTVTKTGGHRVACFGRFRDAGWNCHHCGQRLSDEHRDTELRAQRNDQDRSRCWSMATPPIEANETFTVHLSNASGATISDADGTGTITNDDAAPSFAIDDVTHSEGNSGTTSYVFTVTKTGSTALSSSVDFETSTEQPRRRQRLPGEHRHAELRCERDDQTITVLVNGDTTYEADEAFTVHLSNASGATISDADGTGTITNDELRRASPLMM